MPTPKELIHDVRASLLDLLGPLLKIDRSELRGGASFHELGLDSIRATTLVAALGERFGLPLSPVLAWKYATIDALAGHVARRARGEALDESEAGVPEPVRAVSSDPIAVIGLACRLPGAEDASAFWQLLKNGIDAVTEVPRDRWDASALFHRDPSARGARA